MTLSETEYYQSLADYEDILPYLDDKDSFTFTPPPFIPDYSSSIIVDEIPCIPLEKKDKLCGVLLKLYSKMCPTLTLDDFHMPFDEETNMSHGTTQNKSLFFLSIFFFFSFTLFISFFSFFTVYLMC